MAPVLFPSSLQEYGSNGASQHPQLLRIAPYFSGFVVLVLPSESETPTVYNKKKHRAIRNNSNSSLCTEVDGLLS